MFKLTFFSPNITTQNNFWTSSSKIATINFPASGYRRYNVGLLNGVGIEGYYWSAVPEYTHSGCGLSFYSGFVGPVSGNDGSYGFSARPVSE